MPNGKSTLNSTKRVKKQETVRRERDETERENRERREKKISRE